jgi:hypothetical protein
MGHKFRLLIGRTPHKENKAVDETPAAEKHKGK